MLLMISNTDSRRFPPGDTRLAFVSETSERPGLEIYVMNADDSNLINLTNNALNDFDPTWSPDGTRIAFASLHDVGAPEIYVINPDGSGLARRTRHGAVDRNPAWSPDGARLAFESERDGNFEIYVMNADGSNLTRLTYDKAQALEQRGVKFGRRKTLAPAQIAELQQRREYGVLIKTLMADYRLSKSSVYRYLGLDHLKSEVLRG